MKASLGLLHVALPPAQQCALASYPGSRVGGGERAWYQPIGNRACLCVITCKSDAGVDETKGNNTTIMQNTLQNNNHKTITVLTTVSTQLLPVEQESSAYMGCL